MVKKIVDLHKGSIEVESKDGKTRFSVILPTEKQSQKKTRLSARRKNKKK